MIVPAVKAGATLGSQSSTVAEVGMIEGVCPEMMELSEELVESEVEWDLDLGNGDWNGIWSC